MAEAKRMRTRLASTGILALAVCWLSEGARADVFRCQLPDGRIVFTDREETCPGAGSHTIDAQIQSYDGPPAALERAPANAPSSPNVREMGAKKSVWREKKLKAEQELDALEEKWDYLSQYITHCNRHRKILSANRAGLPYEVSCKNIRSEYSQVKVRMDEIRVFLDKGLHEECRRAGCQPGWIR